MISDSTTGVSSQTIKKLHDHIGHIGQAVESAVPSFVPVTSPPKPLKTPACAAIGRHVFSPLNTFPSSLQGAHVFGLFIDAKGSAPLQDSEGQHGDAPGPGLRDKYGSSSRYDWCVCVRVCRSQACYLATFPKYIILFSRVFICSDYISLYNYIYIYLSILRGEQLQLHPSVVLLCVGSFLIIQWTSMSLMSTPLARRLQFHR